MPTRGFATGRGQVTATAWLDAIEDKRLHLTTLTISLLIATAWQMPRSPALDAAMPAICIVHPENLGSHPETRTSEPVQRPFPTFDIIENSVSRKKASFIPAAPVTRLIKQQVRTASICNRSPRFFIQVTYKIQTGQNGYRASEKTAY